MSVILVIQLFIADVTEIDKSRQFTCILMNGNI